MKVHSFLNETETFQEAYTVKAMLYALDVINSQREFLRGYKLGALILDSCSNSAYALNQSLDFVRDVIGSANLSEYQCRDGNPPKSRQMPHKNVAGVVGGSYSSVTVQAELTLFQNNVRTVPSDNYQARAMIDIALHFNWTYVSLVYSADEYDELDAEAFKKKALKMNICMLSKSAYHPKKKHFRNLLIISLKIVGPRAVILFIGTEYIPELMLRTFEHMRLKRLKKWASEGWDRNNEACTSGPRKSAAEGGIVLMLASDRVPTFEECTQICDAMKHIDGEEFYKKYLLQVKFEDAVEKTFRFSSEGDGLAHYAVLNCHQKMVVEGIQ
uniref:ANF_receptor domain-containing protein n=2 Tax=Loa loa TaxID=7209 RepID=A0A1I7W1E8_LOALO